MLHYEYQPSSRAMSSQTTMLMFFVDCFLTYLIYFNGSSSLSIICSQVRVLVPFTSSRVAARARALKVRISVLKGRSSLRWATYVSVLNCRVHYPIFVSDLRSRVRPMLTLVMLNDRADSRRGLPTVKATTSQRSPAHEGATTMVWPPLIGFVPDDSNNGAKICDGRDDFKQ